MAVDNRIKGQDVTILLAQDGTLLDEFNEISSFEYTDELELISKGYLAQKSEKKDMIFKGVKGSFELDMSSQNIFRLRNAIVNKAKNITPDAEFNVSGVLAFPDGTTPTFAMQNVSFGPIPTNISARADYVKVKLEFACEDLSITFG